MWLNLAVTTKELEQQVRRKLLVKQILALKMPKDLVSVNPESVESYYMQNRNQLGQLPLADLRDKIEIILKSQKNQERFKDWMGAVTRTHMVTYYSGYQIK